MWKDHVATLSEKASKSLANPEEYKNLFPNYDQSLLEEAERHGLAAKVSSNCASVRLPEPQSDGQFCVSKNGTSIVLYCVSKNFCHVNFNIHCTLC